MLNKLNALESLDLSIFLENSLKNNADILLNEKILSKKRHNLKKINLTIENPENIKKESILIKYFIETFRNLVMFNCECKHKRKNIPI